MNYYHYIVTNNRTQGAWYFVNLDFAVMAAQMFDRATVHEVPVFRKTVDALNDRLVWAR